MINELPLAILEPLTAILKYLNKFIISWKLKDSNLLSFISILKLRLEVVKLLTKDHLTEKNFIQNLCFRKKS